MTGPTTWEFIVVGSGPAGAALAGRLARAKTAPTVLLIEAGGQGDPQNKQMFHERFASFIKYSSDVKCYMSDGGSGIDNRTIPYARGRVMGGSSVANFCGWTVGPRDDYDRWAAEVGDESFDWNHRVAAGKLIETCLDSTSPEQLKFVALDKSVHGTTGPINVAYPKTWEDGIVDRLEYAQEAGFPLNKDINSGNPLGFGMFPGAYKDGHRVISTAYLQDAPSNLTIISGSVANNIIINGKRAVGVATTTADYFADKEVIKCCGAIDSPKLLLLSGIGPKEELNKHGITQIIELPVGRDLEDHVSCQFGWVEKTDCHSTWAAFNSDPNNMTEAQAQFDIDKTGRLANLNIGVLVGFFKDDSLLSTADFTSLPQHVQQHLKKPTVPLYELTVGTPSFLPTADPALSYLTILAYVQCPSSTGSVTLASADANDDPIIKLNYLDHPADRAIARAATRAIWQYVQSPSVSKDIISVATAPDSLEDDVVDAYWKANAGTTWHASCTVKMGREDDETACLDKDFRVKGMQDLRVADMSSTPFLLNCHVQAVAYFIGETMAAKLLEEYSL